MEGKGTAELIALAKKHCGGSSANAEGNGGSGGRAAVAEEPTEAAASFSCVGVTTAGAAVAALIAVLSQMRL